MADELVDCPACGHRISRQASSCPGCGHPTATEKKHRRGREWQRFLLVVLLVFGAGIILNGLSGLTELPDCDSNAAFRSVRDALEDAPLRRVMGLQIIAIENARTLSKDNSQISCAGLAKLNNATTERIEYTFYIKDDSIYVEARLPDL